jgi:hypothetical protein
MMRMLTATYAESVSCTPTCEIGESSAHLEWHDVKGTPAHAAVEQRQQPPPHLSGRFVESSLRKVPPATNWWHSTSYSVCEPSHQ